MQRSDVLCINLAEGWQDLSENWWTPMKMIVSKMKSGEGGRGLGSPVLLLHEKDFLKNEINTFTALQKKYCVQESNTPCANM